MSEASRIRVLGQTGQVTPSAGSLGSPLSPAGRHQVDQGAAEAARNASASTELTATSTEIERSVNNLERIAGDLARAVEHFQV